MRRATRHLPFLLMGLGVLAVIYLLLGESLSSGLSGAGGAAQGRTAAALAPGTAELDTRGTARDQATPEEEAAEAARVRAEARAALMLAGLHGVVRDAKGAPIGNATVRLLDDPPALRHNPGAPDGPVLGQDITDASGEYVVGPAPPGGYARLRAEAPGYAPTVQRVRQPGARVDLILDRGGGLVVKVLDTQGGRVVSADVVHMAGAVTTHRSTDAEGFARFDALPTGTGTLVITRMGFGAVRDNALAVAPGVKEERTFVLPAPLEVEGTVIDGVTERPLPGATVTVHYPQLPTLDVAGDKVAVAVTDEAGQFKIQLSVSGEEQASLYVTHEGYAEARMWRNAQARGELQVSLFPAGEAIEGRVVAADGQPAPDVRVTYGWQQMEDPERVPSVMTAKDGTFLLPLLPHAGPGTGWGIVALGGPAGVAMAQMQVPQAGQPAPAELELTLSGAGRVEGVVRDGAGAPGAGALVALGPDWSGQGKIGRAQRQLIGLVSDATLFNLAAVSGADGRYAIVDVPALPYRITASHGLDESTREEGLEVTAGETTEADLVLGGESSIEGWVLDTENKPVAGAYVWAQAMVQGGMNWWYGHPNARSQSDGKFVLRGIGREKYTLWASASGYGNGQQQNVEAGDRDVRLMVKARGWIVGRVFDDGVPYRGTFQVSAQRTDASGNSERARMMNNFGGNNSGQSRTVNTDDGRFELRGLDAGEYAVHASTTDGDVTVQADVVTVVDGRASREARVELAVGAVLTGTVRDDETGQGIANAWIHANPKGATPLAPAPTLYAATDGEGNFEVRGLGGTTYTITAWIQGTSIVRELEFQIGGRRQLDLLREPPGPVAIRVVDEEGRGIEGARANLRMAGGQWIGVNMQRLRKEGIIDETVHWRVLHETNAEGALLRYHVPPGSVTVTATKNGFAAAPAVQVQVGAGRVTQVTITLKPQ
ncbi:MAG: carboxypeptidase regulatory-like domain-containing protein [Planctomycetota bacterium]|nr:carboxypeptidase regulatory-like domain-containing protein [Planctomycetota bacterium]